MFTYAYMWKKKVLWLYLHNLTSWRTNSSDLTFEWILSIKEIELSSWYSQEEFSLYLSLVNKAQIYQPKNPSDLLFAHKRNGLCTQNVETLAARQETTWWPVNVLLVCKN